MSTVPYWSGREVRALREARRMSVREFAAHLGISDRMVSKWEAGGETIRPRPLNQAALDTSLTMAGPDVRSRFTRIAIRQTIDSPTLMGDEPGFARNLVRHPIDGKLMTLVEAGPFRAEPGRRPIWLPAFYIDVNAVTKAEFDKFLALTAAPFDEGWTIDTLLFGQKPPVLVDRSEGVEPVRRSRRTGGGRRERGSRRHEDTSALTGVSREEAAAYATWAGKWLPSVNEWDRAHRGIDSVIHSGVAEWCASINGGMARRGSIREKTGFRCSTPVAQMLTLLAI